MTEEQTFRHGVRFGMVGTVLALWLFDALFGHSFAHGAGMIAYAVFATWRDPRKSL